MKKGPLTGIKVLDLTHAMAGPFASQKLGDMGADVIKVESPKGDLSRWQSVANAFVGEFTTNFLSVNRNKRSIALDLKTNEGKEIIYKLVKHSDVFLHNFRQGVPERLGIDYETLREINPGLIYLSISGYGEEGPLIHRPGQDLVVQGYSGSLWNGGTEGDPPQANGMIIVDPTGSYVAITGILSALIHKLRTGEGQKVEVDLLSGYLDLQIQEITVYLNTGKVPQRTKEPLSHPFIGGPYGVYRTKDGYMTIAMCPLDTLGEVLDHDELKSMKSWEDSMTHRDQIYRIVKDILPQRTTSEWIELFDKVNIWCGPVKTLEEICEDPQVQGNGWISGVQHPEVGEIRFFNNPVRFSKTPTAIYKLPPKLGEHTEEILNDLGCDKAQIESLFEKRIVYKS